MRHIAWVCLLVAVPAWAQWPEYRGPNADGHAGDAGLPLVWSETQNVKWKVAIPGKGWSTPVILDRRLWMTTAAEDGHEMSVVAVDASTGKMNNMVLFKPEKRDPVNNLNSYASPSPVIETGRVYVNFGTYGTAAIDSKTGKVIWQRTDINLSHSQGPGSSPILYRGLLIVHGDGTDVQFVIALDKKTGKTVWKVDRAHDLKDVSPEQRKSYATPVIAKVGDRDQLISQAAQCVFGYDPMTGKEIWRYRYKGYSNVPRPLIHDGLAIFSSGYDLASMFAIRMDGKGDVTDTHQAWSFGPGTQIPRRGSAILVDGRVYMASDGGIATCLDAANGQVVWEKQRLGGEYSASPIFADGRVWFFSQQGLTTALQAGDTFKTLAQNKLEEGCMASPVVHDGALFVRTKTHLYRIQK